MKATPRPHPLCAILATVAAAGIAHGAAPEIQPIPDQTTPESTPLVVQLSVTDADSPVGGLAFQARSDHPIILPDSSFEFQVGGGMARLRITPRPGQPSPVEVVVFVGDGAEIVETSFTLTISPAPGTDLRAVPTDPGFYQREIVDQGLLRKYLINVPRNYDPQRRTPLALVCHGSGQTARSFATRNPSVAFEAEEAGYIVVYPEATFNPEQGKTSWTTNPGAETRPHEDVLFIANLVSAVKSALSVDPDRVYGSGFSGGGVLTHNVAIEHPCLYAAIAPVAASIGWQDRSLPPDPARPAEESLIFSDHPAQGTPVMMIRGRRDEKRPFDGGYNSAGTAIASAATSTEFWRTANGCQGSASRTILPGGTGSIHTYDQCDDDLEVNLVELSLMFHSWPEADNAAGFDGSDAIFNFFDRFTRCAVPAITIGNAADGTRQITWQGTLQSSDDLTNWSDLDPQPAQPLVITPTPGSKACFFRSRSDR